MPLSFHKDTGDGHAIWRIDPAQYDNGTFPGKGGTLIPAMPTPVMRTRAARHIGMLSAPCRMTGWWDRITMAGRIPT